VDWLVADTFPLSLEVVVFCALPMKDTVNSMIINRLVGVLMTIFGWLNTLLNRLQSKSKYYAM
jgi:hypothetical protein